MVNFGIRDAPPRDEMNRSIMDCETIRARPPGSSTSKITSLAQASQIPRSHEAGGACLHEFRADATIFLRKIRPSRTRIPSARARTPGDALRDRNPQDEISALG